MSIIIPNKNSSPVFFPQSNYKIARYLDLTKFISLLQKKSIFFCRLDKLEDHFEGTTAKENYKIKYNRYATQHFRNSRFKKLTEKEIIKNVQDDYDAEQRTKALKCISCWNKIEMESAALWKIYSDFQKGIMITTTIDKIIKSFELAKEDINLNEVKYIDYNTDTMPEGNIMYPVLYKHKAYAFEDEIRLIHTVKFEGGLIYDWSKEKVQQGKYIEVNVEELIDEIVISPYSPNWYLELVQDLTNKYGLNITIKKSELSKN